MQIGTIRMAGRNVALYNQGTQVWLNCNGQTVLQTTYPALFALIGATYGAAPAGQFRLPNYGWDGIALGRRPAGTSPTGYALAGVAGSDSHNHSFGFVADLTHVPPSVLTGPPEFTQNANAAGGLFMASGFHTHWSPLYPNHPIAFLPIGGSNDTEVSPILAVGFYIRGL